VCSKQLVLGISILITIICVSGISAYVYIQNYEKQIKVAAQIEVEKAKIEKSAQAEMIKVEQVEATKRTSERMKWVPWYSNKKEKE